MGEFWPNLGRTRAERRLSRVLSCLEERWRANQLEHCLRNLPLVADLLQDCGRTDEAKVARYPWRMEPPALNNDEYIVNLNATALVPRSHRLHQLLCVINGRRIFWFHPGRLRLYSPTHARDEIYFQVRAASYTASFGHTLVQDSVRHDGYKLDTDLAPGGMIELLLEALPEEYR